MMREEVVIDEKIYKIEFKEKLKILLNGEIEDTLDVYACNLDEELKVYCIFEEDRGMFFGARRMRTLIRHIELIGHKIVD